MNLLSQLIFILIILFFVIIIRKRALTIRRNILLGKKEHKVTTNIKTRIRNLILIAFGQQKKFKKVKYVLYSSPMFRIDDINIGTRLKYVNKFILNNYVDVFNISGYRLLKLKD